MLEIIEPSRDRIEPKCLNANICGGCKIMHRVVYVSCNSTILARDLTYLDERGYKTVGVQSVDMFSHISHVECVIKIQRVK